MDYLQNDQYYIDRYDLRTIRECLDYYNAIKKGFEEKRGLGEFKKYTNKSFAKETQKVLNLLVRTLRGERYRHKAKTIQEWTDKDRQAQEKYDRAIPPEGVTCPDCHAPTKVTSKDLHDAYEEISQCQFMFRCTKCNKGQIFYEDGTEWHYEPPKCPKCNFLLKSTSKDTNEVLNTTYSCSKCKYKHTDTFDFKKSREEREQQEIKDKQLLAYYRDMFCLSDEDGQEYLELADALEVAHEVYNEDLQTRDSPAYQYASQITKIGIVDLEKLLNEKFEKTKYSKLTFDKPEIEKYVTVPFTIQDTDSLRQEQISVADLKKLLKEILENSNWRLVNDSISYRLGYLSGELRGYEHEEDFVELSGKKAQPKPSTIDPEKRMKYGSHNLVQLAHLRAQLEGEENARKKRLIKEPNGFAVPMDEKPTCPICFTTINSFNSLGGWYDKHGFKCLDCQRAANEGILPPEVFEEENSWYTDWHVESEFHIPDLTIKRLVREGKLKPRIVTNYSGKPRTNVFMALENNNLLEAYMQKHKIVLLCGVPASGKSTFGKYLQTKHNFTYVPMEDEVWPDIEMRSLWNNVFEEKRQYNAVEKFVCNLHEHYNCVALDWGFPMTQLEVVSLLKRQWCEIIWLSCSTEVARQRFLDRNMGSVTHFDTQIKNIEENKDKIIKDLSPKVIDVLKADKTNKPADKIYAEFSQLLS